VKQKSTFRSLLSGNVSVLVFSNMMWSLSGYLVWPYQSLFILSLGGSKPLIGLINAVSTAGSVLLYPIGGYIADKAGRVRFVGIATFLYVAGFVPFIFASSWEFLAFALIYQRAMWFYVPALNSLMADSVQRSARGKAYSLTLVLPEAVRILTPYIGGYLISVYTLPTAMRIGYSLGLILGCVVAFIRLRFLKETIEDHEPIGRNVIKIFKDAYSNLFVSVRWILSKLKGYTMIILLLSFIGSIISPFWIVFATEISGLSEYNWGTILLFTGIAKTLVSYFIGGIVDKFGSKKCIISAFLVAIPSLILFTKVSSFFQIFLIYLAVIICNAFVTISTFVFLVNSTPKKMRGRVMAVLGQGIGIGGIGYVGGFLAFIPNIIGSLAGGFIYSLNPTYPWLLQSIFLLGTLVLTLFLIHKPEKIEA
jgi:DHA1 family multidrug resistance protein-like MFS transporter